MFNFKGLQSVQISILSAFCTPHLSVRHLSSTGLPAECHNANAARQQSLLRLQLLLLWLLLMQQVLVMISPLHFLPVLLLLLPLPDRSSEQVATSAGVCDGVGHVREDRERVLDKEDGAAGVISGR